ncbi:MAG TPA: aldo/keto reductase, partial [Candidatus Binataceae bacterium]|nr:aldo/keto reductase [Candidatus Binataceae bacterium]
GNYRAVLDMNLSSIGIGTYLGEPDERDDHSYEDALKAAVLGGINLIDTAVNYRFQRSERNIGKALAELVNSGAVRRAEIVVATKGGYITFDGEVPPDPRAWFVEHFVRSGIVAEGDLADGSHCMTPKWLAAMIEMSRRNLGLETIDIYYLHNPETQLEVVDRKEFLRRIRLAFEALEAAVAKRQIGVFGAATWNGFRAAPTERGWLSLEELWNAAREVGGENHHFRAIQLPLNLAMPEALIKNNQFLGKGRGTTLAVAQDLGIAVAASASLLQGKLSRGLPPIVGETFGGLSSDAQRSIQFVRSSPGVSVALVGMKSASHVRDTLATATHAPAPLEQLLKLFEQAEST